MKVWVIVPFDYSGYSKPIGVFSTLEKAREHENRDQDCNFINIFEMEIDALGVLSTIDVDLK